MTQTLPQTSAAKAEGTEAPAGRDDVGPIWHRYAWMIAVAITVLGFSLRVGDVYGFWINGDEGIYYTVSHAPTWEEARAAIAGNAHPPLFYYLLRVLALMSTDYTVLRLPSLLSGTAVIYLLFLLTQKIAGPVAGLLAALMASLSTGMIMLSQTARPYMVQLVLLIVALRCLLRSVGPCSSDAPPARHAWGYSVAILLAVFVHYSSFQIVGGVGLVLLVLLATRRMSFSRHRPILLAQIPIVLGIAYLYFTHIHAQLMGGELQAEATGSWLKPYFVDGLPRLLAAMFGLCEYATAETVWASPVFVLLGGFAVGVWKPRYRLVTSLCATVFVAAIAMSALGLYPFGGHRHSIYLMCLVIPVSAIGLVTLFTSDWRLSVGTGVVLVATIVDDTRTLSWLGVEPKHRIASALGVDTKHAMPRELSVPVSEIDELESELRNWNKTAGVYITDMQTAYALAPLLQEARANLRWAKAGSNIAYFPWGKRIVIIANSWALEAGRTGLGTRGHIGGLLDRLPRVLPEHCSNLAATNVRILSSQGPKLPNQAERFRRLLGTSMLIDLKTLFAGQSYSFFTIDAGRMRASWVEAMRRAKSGG